MINDINGFRAGTDNSSKTTGSTQTGSASSAAGNDANSAAENTADNSILVSAEAQLLNRLEAEILQAPAVDQARIDALRDSLQNGTFAIDNRSLAESIQTLERLL